MNSLTSSDNYFEDFVVGDRFRHARGKTVTEFDNVILTNLVMNTAQGHFNEDVMQRSEFGGRLVFGGITSAIVLGLAMQDTGENAIAELELDEVRLPTPVLHGDTLYSYSEVLDSHREPEGDRGRVRFRHVGVNQRGDTVFEGERTVLLHARPEGVS